MKKILSLTLSIIMITLMLTASVFAAESFVSNNDGVSSADIVTNIDTLFNQLYEKNGCRVYFHIAQSLNGEGARECADRLYTEKNVGENGERGVVFVLAAQDGDYYLKVGSGLSDVITNAVAQTLLQTFEADYSQGMIDNGLFALSNEICTKLTPVTAEKESGPNVFVIIIIIVLIFAFVAVLLFIFLYIRAERIRRARRRGRMSATAQRRPMPQQQRPMQNPQSQQRPMQNPQSQQRPMQNNGEMPQNQAPRDKK